MVINTVVSQEKYFGTIKFEDKDFNTRGINEFKHTHMRDNDELKHDHGVYTFHYTSDRQNEFSCRTHSLINYFL